MSYSTMIAAANIPPGQAGSLFKLPGSEGLSTLTSAKVSFEFLGPVVVIADSAYDPTPSIDSMDTTLTLVNGHLVSKVADTPNQLSVCVAASAVAKRARTIDAAVSGDNFPNTVRDAFPSRTVPTDSTVSGAFVTIKEAPDQIATCVTQVNNAFSGAGSAMNTTYAAVASAGGPTITTGAQFLAYLGTASDPVKVAVTATLSTSPAAVDATKAAFVVAADAFVALTVAFNETKGREDAAYTFSMSQLTGNAAVSMLTSKSPDVAAILGMCVDSAQVSATALAVAQKLNAAPLPGSAAVTALKSNRPLVEATSPNVSPMSGPDTQYSESEIGSMSANILNQSEAVNASNIELAEWMKLNIEDWKPQVDYNSKKVAAGYTEAVPDGTSTNATIRTIWIRVRDECQHRMDYYNGTLIPKNLAAKKALAQMKKEQERRIYFGRNPYTFLASKGEPVPENEQTTYFDSTK